MRAISVGLHYNQLFAHRLNRLMPHDLTIDNKRWHGQRFILLYCELFC